MPPAPSATGLAAARSRDFDIETGLRTRAHLHADLARLNGIPARLELLALQPDDGLDDGLLAGSDAELPRRLGDALRAASEPHGARAYRLDGTLYAFLGPIEGRRADPGRLGPARARRRLRAAWPPAPSAARHGSPTRRPTGSRALAMAHERLRARSRWQRLSSERQVRDVLLQILSERRAGGSAVALPRVAAHAIGVGRRLGLALSQLDDIVRAAEMQDIGMLAVPEAVLRQARDARARGVGDDPPPPDRRRAHPRPPRPRCCRSPGSCARATSASTAPAIPTGSSARRSRSARA